MNSLTWHCVLVSSILALAAGAAGTLLRLSPTCGPCLECQPMACRA